LQRPDNYRHILAVTFTNKATEEMKSRIIEHLYGIGTGKDRQYIHDLSQETGMSETKIIDTGKVALAKLLHDYTHFSVFTIDSFFQKVIRSFARELGIHTAYNVELDQTSILDEAIDLMLDKLDEQSFLKEWLVDWAQRKIEEGKSWNFKWDIHRLGSELFAEELKLTDDERFAEITDKKRIEVIRLKHEHDLSLYKNALKDIGKRSMDKMAKFNLSSDDFAYKNSGVGGYFRKLSEGIDALRNTYVEKACTGVEAWYGTKSCRKQDIEEAWADGLGVMLEEAVGLQVGKGKDVATSQVILKHLHVLGILSDLMECVKEYTRDQNLILISSAADFLRKIIAESDAPFMYERVGNFYHHFMIDEFQDTSTIQYLNFRPLIENSLASGYADWIVGDVKQSIYRWRNTDWKILAEKAKAGFSAYPVLKKSLNVNRRSAPEVVRFNNAFFREAVEQICAAFAKEKNATDEPAADIRRAYSDAYQYLPENQTTKPQGYVRIAMMPCPKKNGNGEDRETWKEKVMQQLPQDIERLQDMGYRLSDIAILVRENKEAQDIASALLRYGEEHPGKYRYEVLSDESLLLAGAPSVRWLVAAMHLLINPQDLINRTLLHHEQEQYLQSDRMTGIAEMTDKERQEWQSLPVYELASRLIQESGLDGNEEQQPFIQAFRDVLLQYSRREITDVHSFLAWWDEHRNKHFVSMPDGQDAIRLMTIHRAKGMEFNAVLLPFCSWQLAKPGKILWCRPPESCADIPLLPLRFESKLGDTIFVNAYLKEKMMSFIDNLNLLYVAFTRAKKSLLVYTVQGSEEKFTETGDLIRRIFLRPEAKKDENKDCISLCVKESSDGCLIFELGSLSEITGGQSPARGRGKERLAARRTLHTANRNYVPHITRGSAQMDRGKLLHEIFRHITTAEDLEREVNACISAGKLPEKERETIAGTVRQMLQNPTVGRWFSGNIQVKTEAEILLPDGSVARPDRIVFTQDGKVQVIDYKFGEKESPAHTEQVRHYMRQLSGMGYSSVEGFLWYVTQSKIVPVCQGRVT
jgi:ATP-dependent exoDNAse (exonuclease V) beta subunit